MLDPLVLKLVAICFGLLFLLAAVHKLTALDSFRVTLTAYQLLPGALITFTPRSVAASTSMLSRPTPTLAIAFKPWVASINGRLTCPRPRVTIASMTSDGPCIKPTRQPVMAWLLEKPSMTMVRSFCAVGDSKSPS